MIKLKDFLTICDYSNCIFGIYIDDEDRPEWTIEELEKEGFIIVEI